MELCFSYREEHLDALYNMRVQDQLCDVTIHVGGRKFRAHKTVLAATGDYFLTMFTSGFRESSAQEITIEGSAAAFEVLLYFVYTGRVEHYKMAPCISEVLEMACYVQLTHFVNTCSAAILKLLKANTEEISQSDVCKVMLVAKTHDLTAVYQATLRYLEDKVESLKCLDMFLENISATCLQEFLDRENLSNADEEEHVLELVVNWLAHDWEKRKEYSHQLLQKVRLGLVASEDIKKLIGPEILDIPRCSELVNRALDLLASNKPKEILAIENPDIAAARSTIMACFTTIASWIPVQTIPLEAMHDGMHTFSSLVLKYLEKNLAPIILSCGMIKYYDVKRKEWITMNKMDPLPSKSEANIYAGIYELIVVKGILYAAGGTNGREFLKYQASENKWILLSSKPLRKIRIKLVSFGAYIYAVGGCCSPKDQVIERYDISAEKWEVLNMVQDHSGPGRFTLLAKVMDTVEKTGKCKCSQHGRREIFAVVFDGKIFVSSLKQKNVNHLLEGELVVFDPVMNTYQIQDFGGGSIEEEDLYRGWNDTCYIPTLFIHEDQLYWMMTEHTRGDNRFTVHRLRVTEEDGKTTVGYSDFKLENVELLCDDDEDYDTPICIQDNIFLKQSETAGSDHEAAAGAAGHDKVKYFPQYGENKQLIYIHIFDLVYPVWFSFERKLTV